MARRVGSAFRGLICALTIVAVTAPTVASAAGEILSSTPIAGAPDGASAFRIRYRSADKDGRPITVSGAIIVPRGVAPAGGRPVVVWAHGASGIAESCGLSDKPTFFGQIPGLSGMLSAGYVVAAPDYQGLGSTGPHPFLVGPAAAHSVLDSVRAARAFPVAKASSRYALWGESLGGFSVLWAGKLSARYAPDLKLVGVAAVAPPTNLKANLTGGGNAAVRAFLTSYAAESWSRVYGVPLTTAVKPATARLISAIAKNCVSLDGFALRTKIGLLRLARQLRNVDLAGSPRWAALMQQNSVTPAGLTMPLLVVQGSADVIVAPDVTRATVAKLCAGRANVRFIDIDGGDHMTIAKRTAPTTLGWLSDRFSGKLPVSSC